jgi:hypothetical protein
MKVGVMSKFDELARVLFEGDVVATDFKTMPGTGADSRDQMAKSLLESMKRVGLVRDGKLVSPE